MPNYNLGKVYKIECLNDDNSDIYVGSTCEPYLSNRLAGHKSKYKCFLEGKAVTKIRSCQLFQKYGVDNCVITLLELVNCESKAELLQRERHYIKTLQCVNKVIPLRTDREYRVDNKVKILNRQNQYNFDHKEARKEYYDDNKIKIQERSNVKFICECGGKYTYSSTTRHLKTNMHKLFICQSI